MGSRLLIKSKKEYFTTLSTNRYSNQFIQISGNLKKIIKNNIYGLLEAFSTEKNIRNNTSLIWSSQFPHITL